MWLLSLDDVVAEFMQRTARGGIWKSVAWSSVVVLEGLTSTRAAAADYLCYRIWVEAPDEVRLQRGLERDGETHRQLWLDSMRVERQFFAGDATRNRADLRIDGHPSVPHDSASEIVLLDQLERSRQLSARWSSNRSSAPSGER